MVRTGSQGPPSVMPQDLPPGYAADPPGRRGIKAGVFENRVPDLRAWWRLAKGQPEHPPRRSWTDARCSRHPKVGNGWLRGTQEADRQPNSSGGGYARFTPGIAGDARPCTGARTGPRMGSCSTKSHRRCCASCFGRSRVHR